ncbi:hypothetical protein [Halorussus halobius]|nr:hypothetical protein [Halorussus halobius]
MTASRQTTLDRFVGRFTCDCGAVRWTYAGLLKHRSARRCWEGSA